MRTRFGSARAADSPGAPFTAARTVDGKDTSLIAVCATEAGCQAIAQAFADLATVSPEVAAQLVAAARAAGATSCAVILRTSERTFACSAGEARTYQHVGNRLVPLPAGEGPSAASQLLIVASGPLVGEQRDFLGTGPGSAIAIAFAQHLAPPASSRRAPAPSKRRTPARWTSLSSGPLPTRLSLAS